MRWSRCWLLLLLLQSSWASAHLLKVFAYTEGSQLHGSSYFAGGNLAAGVQVRIFDAQGQLLTELVSDSQGEFSYPLAEPGDYRIVADSGDGHQAQWQLSGSQPNSQVSAKPDSADAELALLVEQAVARQVGPLRQQLDRFSHRTKLADIIGGLGLIFGLAGMLMWWRSRR